MSTNEDWAALQSSYDDYEIEFYINNAINETYMTYWDKQVYAYHATYFTPAPSYYPLPASLL